MEYFKFLKTQIGFVKDTLKVTKIRKRRKGKETTILTVMYFQPSEKIIPKKQV